MTHEDGGYLAFAERIRRTRVLSDPWLDGAPRFREEPVVLSRYRYEALCEAAEAMARISNEVGKVVLAEPSLLDSFFALTPFQKLMWLASAPAWHGIARADVFLTEDGVQVCELNCDTPSGEAEAVLLGHLARETRPDLMDPCASLLTRFVRMASVLMRASAPRAVGIVYPTEMPEDLSMIALYRAAFEREGWRVVLGSPFNLSEHESGRAALLGVPCDAVVRHYKTDWWGEREPVWRDAEPLLDAAPLVEPLACLLRAKACGKTVVINPFGAVLPQNKRAMAFMWEEKQRFSPWAQRAIERWVPETRRLEAMDTTQLARERSEWVMKSDYGCEGAEVVLGADVDDDEWARSLELARPGRWVVQRRFRPLVETAEGESLNYGVYVVAGRASGILSRVQVGRTDERARTAPTLVEAVS